MWKPVWAGPGLWYDKDTGRIHCRLAQTHIDLPPEAGHEIVNYRGETDPRRLPLVVAPFNSTPLTVDQAMHVRFQDLVVRGGGYITVDLVFGVDLVFENCLIYCGTYGIWSKNTGPFTMTDCGVYGNMQPWAFRSDTALYSYDGRVYPPFVGGSKVEPEKGTSSGKIKGKERVVRHLSRMSTHAVLVTEGFHEFEVFAHPFNHDWEISNCEFTDGHDGVYLSGRNIRFHHNWVANMNDDGLYLSSPTPFVTDKLYVYQNLISTVVAPFGTHGRGGPGGDIHVYRNVVDQRGPIQYVRPSPERPGGYIANGTLALLTHGSALHMEHMNFYHNTILQSVPHPRWWGGGLMGASANAARRVFNNIIVYYQSHYFDRTWEGYPKFALNAKEGDLQTDGNLHWHAEAGTNVPPDFLENVRTHPLSATNKAAYPPGWAANSLVADPGFVAFDRARTSANDYRLRKDSPAIGAGIILPGEFEDPLRPAGDKRPDIGAMPLGSEPLRVGINGRITAGTVEGLGHFRRPE